MMNLKRGFVIGLVSVVAVTGCARKVQLLGQSAAPTVAPSAVPSAAPSEQAQAIEIAPPDLTHVSMTESNLKITDPSVLAYELITQALVVRAETYENQNPSAVWVWVRPSVSALHFWGLCAEDRAQYLANAAAPGIQVQGGELISKAMVFDDWSVIEVPGNSSVKVTWMTGGSWNWVPGPYQAPAASCNETNPQRGWAGFQIDGVINEDVRVSIPEVSVSDATGSPNFLDSSRVLSIKEGQESLSGHWGDWP